MKNPRFADIPQFTVASSYRVDVSWDFLEDQLAHWNDRTGGLGGLDMNPDFQRAHVWTEGQQIKFVEYQLRGGLYGREIYWNNPNWHTGFGAPTVLVDGKKRLEAVRKIIRNENKAFGYYNSEYEDRPRIVLCRFTFNMNTLKTRREVLQWYLDINTGGTPHTPEEIERVRELLRQEKKNES